MPVLLKWHAPKQALTVTQAVYVDVDVEAPVYVDVDVFRRCRCRCVLQRYTEMCFADVFSRSYKTYRSLL